LPGALFPTRAAFGDYVSATQGHDFALDLRPRRSREWRRETFDAIVIATGPAHGTVFATPPLLAQIGDIGLARPDPLGLGIDIDLQGHAIGRDGHVAGTLFVAGPLGRGTFGELTGAPDLAPRTKCCAMHQCRDRMFKTLKCDVRFGSRVDVSRAI